MASIRDSELINRSVHALDFADGFHDSDSLLGVADVAADGDDALGGFDVETFHTHPLLAGQDGRDAGYQLRVSGGPGGGLGEFAGVGGEFFSVRRVAALAEQPDEEEGERS